MPRGVFEDLTGRQFGVLTIIEQSESATPKNGRKVTCWLAQCVCGKRKHVQTKGLSKVCNRCTCPKTLTYNGETRTYAEWANITGISAENIQRRVDLKWEPERILTQAVNPKIIKHPRSFTDITGQKFGKLTVLYRLEPTEKNGRRKWKCECECGNFTEVSFHDINDGAIKSCGCWGESFKSKHKMSRSAEYDAWNSMRGRCYNTSIRNYAQYGGRGIKVCDEWLNSFDNFLQDLGLKPEKNYSLDRIDVNGNYEPANCRWASPQTQANNRRTNMMITYNNITQSASDWSRDTNISASTIRTRIRQGWPAEKALTTPGRAKK